MQSHRTPVPDFDAFKSLIAANPNRGKGLDRLSSGALRAAPALEPALSVDLPGVTGAWTEYDVSPAGPLSALQFIMNPLYGPATHAMRGQMLLEAQTAVAEKVDSACRGSAGKLTRQRKKIQEWLGTDPALLDDAGRTGLWEALATVYEFQAVVLKEGGSGAGSSGADSMEISFAPARIDLWRSDRPVYFVEKALSKVWVYAEKGLHAALGPWLSAKEGVGGAGAATIAWPVAEGTKAELIEVLQVLPTWRADYAKRLKDDLAAMAGRAAAVTLLGRWLGGVRDVLEDF